MAKKKHSFAWSPIRRLMKQQGASIVARNAVDLLIDHLEKTAVKLTEQARAFNTPLYQCVYANYACKS